MAIGPVLLGEKVDLLPVKPEDAVFIISLRTNPELNRYLHSTNPDICLQRKWIQEQMQRAGDFYYVICEKSMGLKVGLIGVYNCTEEHVEVGRWICMNPICAVESLLLSCDFAFSRETRRYVIFTVHPENKKVIALHKTLGAMRSEDTTLKAEEPLLTNILYRETFTNLKKKFM